VITLSFMQVISALIAFKDGHQPSDKLKQELLQTVRWHEEGAAVVGVEGRQDDDLGRAVAPAPDFGGREAVHPRHADVHQHDVGRVFGDGVLDLAAVSGLADDLDVVGVGEKPSRNSVLH
jgi:hypothetical protein